MDNRLLIEISRTPEGKLQSKIKHLKGDTEIDEEIVVYAEGDIPVERPTEVDDDSDREAAVVEFFDAVKNTAVDALFPEYKP
jgi:hypothetical protein